MPHNPAALVIAVVLLTYWARVIRMAARTRRHATTAGHLVPPEKLGRLLRIAWYPAVLVWTVQPIVAGFRANLPWLLRPLPLPGSRIVGWICAVVAVACLAATWVCWKRMGRSWRMGIDPNERTQLVITGPYAFVRHPIYALSSLLMMVTMLAVPSPLMLVAGAIHLLLLQWEARREEQYLIGHHGEAYVEYRRHVGRFLPRSVRGYSPVRAG